MFNGVRYTGADDEQLTFKLIGTATLGDALAAGTTPGTVTRGVDGDILYGKLEHMVLDQNQAPVSDLVTLRIDAVTTFRLAGGVAITPGWHQLWVNGLGAVKIGTTGPFHRVIGSDATRVDVVLV